MKILGEVIIALIVTALFIVGIPYIIESPKKIESGNNNKREGFIIGTDYNPIDITKWKLCPIVIPDTDFSFIEDQNYDEKYYNNLTIEVIDNGCTQSIWKDSVIYWSPIINHSRIPKINK